MVLPVHNAQSDLVRQVEDILEVLPELARRFELLIVDDGSTDGTEEVAHELACQYPQVLVARHASRQGPAAALHTGLEKTNGDIVFVQDPRRPIRPADVRRLWQLRAEEDLVIARPAPSDEPVGANLIERLMTWGVALTGRPTKVTGSGGIQMVRRDGIDELRRGTSRRFPPGVKRFLCAGKADDEAANRPDLLSRLKNLAVGQ